MNRREMGRLIRCAGCASVMLGMTAWAAWATGVTGVTGVTGTAGTAAATKKRAAKKTAGEVIITEIMYNPDSPERSPATTEWVEIYNTGEQAVDLAGWRLADEDGKTAGLPRGASIGPRKAVVLIPAGDKSVEKFKKAWGGGFEVYALGAWYAGGMNGLANSPSHTNEVLRLRKNDYLVADKVNYDDVKPCPSDSPDGASIHLMPDSLTAAANDDGSHWRRSKAGVDGAHAAKKTEMFSDKDVGSPGVVARSTPQPPAP